VPNQEVQEMKKVLVAIDGSEVSKSLIDYAFHYAAREKDAQLIFMHVIESKESKDISIPGYTTHVIPSEEEVKSHFEEMVREIRDSSGYDVSSYTVEVKYGVSYEEIINFAEKEDVSMIMIGHRRMTRLKRFFLGSVAAKVVAHAPCSVYVHRPKELMA
jgi:nucleotide-binding universal stress UspA family protein